jgi:hypothetical protein
MFHVEHCYPYPQNYPLEKPSQQIQPEDQVQPPLAWDKPHAWDTCGLSEAYPSKQNVPRGTCSGLSKRIYGYEAFHVEHKTHFAQKNEALT